MADELSQFILKEPSDEELLQMLSEGDQAVVQVLYERYQDRLVAHAVRYLPAEDLAQDVVQETFLKLLDEPPGYLQGGLLGPWLFRVARNLAIDRARRRKFEVTQDDDELSLDEVSGGEDDPLTTLMASSDAEQLRHLCGELPGDLQVIVHDRIVENLSFQEIADKERIPLGTALWRVHHAFEILRRRWLAES